MSDENAAVASRDEEHSDEQLKDIFLKAWTTYEELENLTLASNSYEFHSKVKSAIADMETATRIVSRTGLFSSNELIDEVTTESLQYLLLPYFLGKLVLKLQDNRLEVLNVAEIYFKDFLQRCEEYELCISKKNNENDKKLSQETAGNDMAQLMRAAHSRNDKIAQFREKKELEERIKHLRNLIKSETVDEELKREYFIKLIKKCIIEAREELESVQLEKQMAQMRQHEKSQTNVETNSYMNEPSGSHGHQHHHHREQPKRKPLQPFIITRDATQKAVFGMGYPSLPVMTVDDFYEQRVAEGIFPDAEKMTKINQAKAIQATRDPEEVEEEEKSALETQIENDDPEYIARMRRMDEYKDMVRRGDGNRYNRS